MKPFVSILMSTYNDEAFIKQALESVVKQTYIDWEFIITDDNSTDGTARILADYATQDSRFQIIRNNENKKLTANLNSMLNLAKGQLVARIDSDDCWSDDKKLEMQVNFLNNNPDHVLVGAWASAVNVMGKEVFKISYPTIDGEIRKSILKHNCFVHSSVLFNLKALNGERYDNGNNYSQDYELWLKLGTKGKLANIPRFMVNYRINPQGTSQKDYKIQTEHSYRLISMYKGSYPNYYASRSLWFARKYYPAWLRLTVPKIKNLLYF